MVCLAGSVVAMVATGGAAAPAVAAGFSAGINSGVAVGGIGAVGSAVGAASTAAAVGTSAVVGGVGGAMVGASAAGTAAGAAAAASAAGGAAAGAASAAAMTASAAGVLSGPVGWVVLGTAEEQTFHAYTFDCWKQVLHDDSTEPSNGRLLKDIVVDPRIKRVTTTGHDNVVDLPYLVLENIWDEQFFIQYVRLESNNQLAAHAIQIQN